MASYPFRQSCLGECVKVIMVLAGIYLLASARVVFKRPIRNTLMVCQAHKQNHVASTLCAD